MIQKRFLKSRCTFPALCQNPRFEAFCMGMPAQVRQSSTSMTSAFAKSFFMITCLALLFLLNSSQLSAQTKYNGIPSLIWPKLYDIRYEKANDDLGEYNKPVFSQAARSLEGKVVTLPGYIISNSNTVKGKTFILSSLPANACFFCGVGGPESVVEVSMKESISFTEKPVEIRGILRLNDKDPDGMIYKIEQAEYLGEIESD